MLEPVGKLKRNWCKVRALLVLQSTDQAVHLGKIAHYSGVKPDSLRVLLRRYARRGLVHRADPGIWGVYYIIAPAGKRYLQNLPKWFPAGLLFQAQEIVEDNLASKVAWYDYCRKLFHIIIAPTGKHNWRHTQANIKPNCPIYPDLGSCLGYLQSLGFNVSMQVRDFYEKTGE